MPEPKDLAELVQEAVDELHKASDRQDAEIKAQGEITGETKAAVEKIQTNITALLASQEEVVKAAEAMEVKLQRQAIPSAAGDQGPKSEEAKARSAAFFKWIRGGKVAMEPQERKALVENAIGLILVPEDLEAEISRALPPLTPMRGLCGQRTTTRDKIRRRSLTEVAVGWGKLETGGPLTETTLVPSDAHIHVEDLYGLAKIGEDELMDTDANLQTHIASSFSVAIATAENRAFVVGSGHVSKEPEGLAVDAALQAGGLIGGAAGAEGDFGYNLATADTIIPDDMLRIEYKLPPQYLPGAKWLMHRKTELTVRLVKKAVTGGYLWQPSLLAGQPPQFDGYPIVNSADMNYPADTLDQKIVAIFGNFKLGYLVVDRQGIALQRLDELYAEAGLVGFKVHFRVGGGPVRYDTFTVLSNESS